MDVILCEKPSQGREVAKILGLKKSGKGYIEGQGKVVTWCVGHLLEMFEPQDYDPKYKKWVAEDLPILPETFKHRVKTSVNSQYRIIEGFLKKASLVIIATDGDNEGEAIARDVLDRAKYRGEIRRAWITSTDELSVKEAFNNLKRSEETILHAEAARGRRYLDWMMGMNFSRALACSLAKRSTFKISFGRCQTATLAIATQREIEIQRFKAETHFGVKAKFATNSDMLEMDWVIPESVKNDKGILQDKEVVNFVIQHVSQSTPRVIDADYTPKKQSAPLPYKLSGLIKDAARFGLSPKDTDDAMQTLYEPPISAVTYPRTDCTYLPTSMLDWVPDILSNALSSGYDEEVSLLDPNKKAKCWSDKGMVGKSHHAIIPTRKRINIDELPNENAKIIYDLVMRRFLCQFAPMRELSSSRILVDVDGLTFQASGSAESFPGWKSLVKRPTKDTSNEAKESLLPIISEDTTLVVRECFSSEKQTKKPSRFTLASLLDEMGRADKYCQNPELKKILKEGDGIGTEATRSDIIQEIVKKKQVRVSKDNVITVPREVVEFITNVVPDELKSVDLTAALDISLEAIQKGDLELNAFIAAQKAFVAQTVASLLGKNH